MPLFNTAGGGKVGGKPVVRAYLGNTLVVPGKTNSITNPTFNTSTAGTTVVRSNLILDPSFTSGVFSGGRGAPIGANNGDSAVIAAAGRLGGLGLRRTGNTSATTPAVGWGQISGVVQPGTYTASLWARSSTDITVARYREGTATATIASIPTAPQSGAVALPAGVWVQIKFLIIVTVAGTLKPGVTANVPNAGDYVDFDDWMLEPGDQLRPYFDGSTAAALGVAYSWTGTADNSASVAKAATSAIRTNLCTRPNAESATVGYSATVGATVTHDTAFFRTGTASVKMVLPATAYSGIEAYNAGLPIVMTAGQKYAFSAWVYAANPLALTWWVSENGDFGSTSVPAGVWTRISGVYTAAASGTRSWRLRQTAAAPVATTVWIDGILIEQVDNVVPYYDGSFPSIGDVTYGWAGTANESASWQLVPAATGWANGSPSSGKAYQGQYNGKPALICIQQAISGDVRASVAPLIPVEAGKTYTVLLGVVSEGGSNLRLESGVSFAFGISAAPTSSYQQLRLTFTSATTGNAPVQLVASGLATGARAIIVDAMMVEGTHTGPYRDGDSPGWTWSGTAHASASFGLN